MKGRRVNCGNSWPDAERPPCRPTCNVNPCQPLLTNVNQCHPDAERPTCNVKPPLHLRLNKWSIIFGRLFSERESGIQRLMFGHCCCISNFTHERKYQFLRSCNCVDCTGQLASKDQDGQAGRIVFLQVQLSRDQWCL